MDNSETGQVADEAAEVYENFFVPALFGQWPGQILDLVSAGAGMSILDIGCGTGVLARAAMQRVAPGGSVTGLDPNPGMLAVARSSDDTIDWREGVSEEIPFEDATFDRVVSQFALMFFADREGGLREMSRVGVEGTQSAIATWAALEKSPGYAAMVDLLRRLFGDEAAAALRAPFVLGAADELGELISTEFDDVDVHEVAGTARFESIDAWVHTDIRGWTLANMISDAEFDMLLGRARNELAQFAGADGTVEFAAPALIATAHCR